MEEIRDIYQRFKNNATRLAGGSPDIIRRAALLHGIFLNSKGNHTFPQIALHGALWAAGFFETTRKLGTIIQWRYFYNSRERTYRMSLLKQFYEGFRNVNRSVFIDTYTNYYFSKEYGNHPEAATLLHPELLKSLNNLHEAVAKGKSLTPAEKKTLFMHSLQWEQEITAAPGVRAEVARFDCPILTFICLKPIVHFEYFPKSKYLLFKNFSETNERIANAVKSYEVAEMSGWNSVVKTMDNYNLLPKGFSQNPHTFLKEISA